MVGGWVQQTLGSGGRRSLMIIVATVSLVATALFAAAGTASAATVDADAMSFWGMVNQERVDRGLDPLHLQLTLSANAERVLVEALADDGAIEQAEGQLDSVPAATIGTDGRRGVVMCCGSVGFDLLSDHLDALLASPTTPLLSPDYTHMGIGIAPAVDPRITQPGFRHIMIHLVDVTADAPSCQGTPATISGTEDDDIISGTSDGDVIVGFAGRDRIFGQAGDDLVCGGDGIDYIWGNGGEDDLWGEGGSDRLRGGSEADELWGGSGADRMWGGDGADMMQGQGGKDFMWGGEGNDTMQGNHQSDDMRGGPGDDDIRAATGKDILIGGAGADVLYGGDNTDFMVGGSGDDRLFGGRGIDALYGDDGVDVLDGQRNSDECTDDFATTTFVSCAFRMEPLESEPSPSVAQWQALRECESGDVYDINTGNNRYGAYQFTIATWDSVAARYMPALVGVRPDLAAASQQDMMAFYLYLDAGASAWPSCGGVLAIG